MLSVAQLAYKTITKTWLQKGYKLHLIYSFYMIVDLAQEKAMWNYFKQIMDNVGCFPGNGQEVFCTSQQETLGKKRLSHWGYLTETISLRDYSALQEISFTMYTFIKLTDFQYWKACHIAFANVKAWVASIWKRYNSLPITRIL